MSGHEASIGAVRPERVASAADVLRDDTLRRPVTAPDRGQQLITGDELTRPRDEEGEEISFARGQRHLAAADDQRRREGMARALGEG